VKKITVPKNPRGMRFTADSRRLFVASEQAHVVSVVDMATFTVEKSVPTGGSRPVDVALSPDGKRAWVSHGDSGDLRVLDAVSLDVLATIPVGPRAWWTALTPDGSRLYVTVGRAGEVAVVDTLGIASPEAVTDLVGATLQYVDGVPVHFHGHDDFGLATAAAVAAVRAGATWIHGTINGMGERAGNASLAEVALALRGLYGIETRLRLESVRAFSERLRALSGYELEPYKPLVGENLFTRESGAVASQFHDPPAIEPYSSGLVAAERKIVLGKKSGLDSIRIKAEELGLDLDDDTQRDLLARVKELGTRKRGLVTDEEFRKLARG